MTTLAGPALTRTVLLAADNKNSVMVEVAEDACTSIAYCAYGEQSAQHSAATHLGFNGQIREAKIGWYLLGNGYRAYNPCLMRFHSPDTWSPFGRGGLNPYMYCAGDPVNKSDPTGHVFFQSVISNLSTLKNTFAHRYQAQRAVGHNPVQAVICTVSSNHGMPHRLGGYEPSGSIFNALPRSRADMPSAKEGGLHHKVGGVPSSTPGSDASYNGSGLANSGETMWDRLARRGRATPVAYVAPNYGPSKQGAVVRPSQSAPKAPAPAAPPTVRNGAAIQPSRPEQRWDTSSAWSGESGASDWSVSSNASVRGSRH